VCGDIVYCGENSFPLSLKSRGGEKGRGGILAVKKGASGKKCTERRREREREREMD
jgi:hypothetical protein